MTRELLFVLPADRDAVSGGNLYNAHLLAALTRRRAPVRALGVEEALGRRPRIPDAQACFLVDSVLLPRVPELVAAAGRAPVLVLVHLFPSFVFPNVRAAERRLLAGVAGFVVTCEPARERVADLAEGRPILVVPPALVVRPERLEPRPPGFRGLIAGNLIRCKGTLDLLERLDPTLREGNPFTLDVLGRDDLEPEYARACRARVADSPRLRAAVRIHAPVPVAEMPAWYQRSSVFVSPATFETYGMAMHEARAFGLPLLAVATGNARAFVTRQEHGALFTTHADLAAAIVRLIRDPEALRLAVRDALVHRLVDDRSWDDAARALLSELESRYP